MKRDGKLTLFGDPHIESILAVPPQAQIHSFVASDRYSCVDCYDCDYNCEECDNCNCDGDG